MSISGRCRVAYDGVDVVIDTSRATHFMYYYLEEIDQSDIPYKEQSLLYRLKERARIRRNIHTRKSVQNGDRDYIADLLEESARELEKRLP